jgi:hypothetical protein
MDPQIERCPDCSTPTRETSLIEESFQYGIGSEAVTLKANVETWTCPKCGCQWTGEQAEGARQEAVHTHLAGLVKSLREELVRARVQGFEKGVQGAAKVCGTYAEECWAVSLKDGPHELIKTAAVHEHHSARECQRRIEALLPK